MRHEQDYRPTYFHTSDPPSAPPVASSPGASSSATSEMANSRNILIPNQPVCLPMFATGGKPWCYHISLPQTFLSFADAVSVFKTCQLNHACLTILCSMRHGLCEPKVPLCMASSEYLEPGCMRHGSCGHDIKPTFGTDALLHPQKCVQAL